MAQLLLGGVLLVPLLIRGHVLGVPLGQLRLMLGAASAAFGALVLDARVQLRPAGLDARRARGMICAEIVVEVVAPLAHVLDELRVLLLDAVDEAVALGLEVGKHIVLRLPSSAASSSVWPSRCSSTSSVSMLPK